MRRPEPTEESLTPPHSDEAEQAVIGALLLDNSVLDLVADLKGEMFYRPAYGQVFEQIKVMVVAAKVADVLTVGVGGVLSVAAADAVPPRWRRRPGARDKPPSVQADQGQPQRPPHGVQLEEGDAGQSVDAWQRLCRDRA